MYPGHPGEWDSNYMLKEISRLRQDGRALSIYVPKKCLDMLAWKPSDRVVVSVIGSKLLIERIPMEELASLKFATAEVQR